MHTFFISDLHLEERRPDIAGIFLNFLEKEAIKADALYILGDFFEVWIGDDHLSEFNKTIIAALKCASLKGLPIYIMRGNRDFLLGKRFIKASGCHLLPDEYVINLYGTPVLLMHGDTLCTEDVKYLRFRKKSRNWLIQKMFLLKSLEKRLEIVRHYREASKLHVSTLPDYIMDVTQSEVLHVLKKHNVKHLIHGHTHREQVHHFAIDNQEATRTVLGAWHHYGHVYVHHDNGESQAIVIK